MAVQAGESELNPAISAGPASTERSFLRRHGHVIFVWPLLGLLLTVLLWIGTLSQLQRDHQQVEEGMVRHAESISRAYAEQLRRAVEQVDRITLSLKYDWEDPDVVVDLEKQRGRGLYPDNSSLVASIIDREGRVVSTSGLDPSHLRVEADFFMHHMTDARDDLLISEAHVGRRVANNAIRFTRRINGPDGGFAGVVLVSVEPQHLVSFYDEAMLGAKDFITLRRMDGPVLATRLGHGSRPAEIFYRSDPQFPGPSGVMREGAERFWDDEPRIVAWRRLDGYPLVALAALSETSAFAAYRAGERRALAVATAGSVFLFLFTVVGMGFSARLAWRRQQADEVKQTYRLAVDAAREGFYMFRALKNANGKLHDFQIQDCNERAATMLGTTRDALLGARLSELYEGAYRDAELERMQRAMEGGYLEEEVRVPPESRLQAAWVHRRLVRSGAGLAVTIRDVSEARAQQEALAAMANVDAVTGLPNRHWLGNFLPRALEQAKATDTRVAILFVDLDDFKNINDTLGHAAGDELLKAAALRLKALVRASDHVVRLGGDEFTLVLQQVHRMDDVARVARLIVTALSEPFALGDTSGHTVQASVGISVYPDDGEDGETLLKHADIAMYAAKAGGKGRYHFYHAQLSDTLLLRIQREQALRQAIERDEFVLHYQPRVDTATGRLLSVEALVRWLHPERGMVPPLEFIQVAEDTGLILRLGRMVIEKACAQIAQWKAEGLPVVPVSINVSALQFNDGHVKDILADCMHRYRV
ncbi:MAG TPA: diguanylate cyclase, partial [Noviherbaspirillum sp.]|nr:diguanylate cyclase [Noviherbaspirillum sp.]